MDRVAVQIQGMLVFATNTLMVVWVPEEDPLHQGLSHAAEAGIRPVVLMDVEAHMEDREEEVAPWVPGEAVRRE